MPMIKYRLTFYKNGRARFIGHLDLVSAFRHAVQRARLPVKYSEGFNPHMELGVASPLPLGMDGGREYADIALTEDRDVYEALKNSFPAGTGIGFTEAVRLPDSAKSTASLIRRAEYSVYLQKNAETETQIIKNISELLSKEHINIEKKSKSGEIKTVDIRPGVFHLSAEDARVRMELALGDDHSVKPETIINLLAPNYACEIRYVREKLILLTELD